VAGLNGEPSAAARSGAFSALARQQYAALIWLQSRIFLNSFRTMRGSFELGARVLTGFVFFMIAVGPAFGMGFGAYEGAAHQFRLVIAMLLWALCLLWQCFSALAPALAGQNPDLSHLLRYPVSFGSWIVLYLVYGVLAPSTLIGIFWTVGIGIGLTVARPELFLWTALTLALFVVFNVLLARTILAWIERWMAQRKTREIVTGIFLFLALGAQAFNPAFHQHGNGLPYGLSRHKAVHLSHRVWATQAVFPPGAATVALTQPMLRSGNGILPLGGLALYTFAVAGLLCVRLRAESRGENLSQAPRRAAPLPARQARRRPVLDFSGPIAAIFEKDLRYLMRSGPMLYALAAPLVMVFLFGGAFRSGSFTGIRSTYALPLGLAWAFLGLTRVVCNNLGAEGEGLSLYFLSPTPMRTVILAKNALHLALFGVEAVLITLLVIVRFGAPTPSVAAATLAWILFAVPTNFAAGNLLSILMPYRLSMVRMRNEPGAVGNGLVSTLIQAGMLGVGAAVFVPFSLLGHPWLATPIFLVLAGVGTLFYLRVLANVDRMIQARRESLMLDLAKTAAAS
jgi:ABC-2 type transport system permease protein